jgi:hypothetical protein
MRRMDHRALALRLAGHLTMGALLGTGLAIALIVMNSRQVLEMIAHSSAPRITAIVFVSVFTLICAVGASITGFLFTVAEEAQD